MGKKKKGGQIFGQFFFLLINEFIKSGKVFVKIVSTHTFYFHFFCMIVSGVVNSFCFNYYFVLVFLIFDFVGHKKLI